MKMHGVLGSVLFVCVLSTGGCGGGGTNSNASTATVPAAPTTLAAVAVSATAVDLTWTDMSGDETGFKIERSTDGATYTQIGTLPPNTTAYSDSALANLTKYYYRVRAGNATGDSAYSAPASATTQPPAGTAWFSSPYAADGSAPPSPATALFAKSTAITKMDVGIVVDTTGSMGGTIAALKSNLSTTVIPGLQGIVTDTAIGILGEDDFPYGAYGTVGCDLPAYVASSPNGYVTTVAANSQTAVNSLTAHCGNDASEGQLPAMVHALTGVSLNWPSGSVAAASPPAGTFGGLHFRSNALPIIVSLTDVSFHNGRRALDKTGTTYDSTYQDAYSFTTYNADDLVSKINLLGAKFIGGAADNGARAMGTYDPYGHMAYIADLSGSVAPPSAFTPSAGCTAGQCCTGVAGAGVAADGPTVGGTQQCRMVFSYTSGNGNGLDTGLVNAVKATVNALSYDVYVQLYNDAAETIDAVGNLVQKVEPVPAGGTDAATGTVCATFNLALLRDNYIGPKGLAAGMDYVADTIAQVGGPSAQYCFQLTPKANSTIPPTATTQVHKIWMRTLLMKPGGGTLPAGADLPIYFIVP